MSLLNVSGVTKTFGGLTAVDDLTFAVDGGQILGVIGPNGAGKTTLFNCVMGVYDIDAGTVTFDGADVTSMVTHQIVNRGLARVAQHSMPIEPLTVRENLELFTLDNTVLQLFGGADEERVESVAERLDLTDVLDEYPDSLPHADLRRLEIARALATDPELLLLDEPFAGLNKQEMRNLSEAITAVRDDGITIVIIDHNMRGLMHSSTKYSSCTTAGSWCKVTRTP
ncbi:ABC transporter ATP-binding protein [Halarchaeum acidiphilum]|uniref:ABC transporter ATP-binding protein n=1 Tax=Halarchaeum acidiphilum TaxID=489138 RepID=UPI000ABE28D1|nr:ATP-binding cassette domain-containing protein [Halarchaeum acidiphilum]